jgi:hypothetical protein
MNTVPLLIEFVRGTSLYREPAIIPKLRIIHNGPPGTFVVFADGARVPLPTDQIVLAEDSSGGRARRFRRHEFWGDGRRPTHLPSSPRPSASGAAFARAWPEDDLSATHDRLDLCRRTSGLAVWLFVSVVGPCHFLARDSAALAYLDFALPRHRPEIALVASTVEVLLRRVVRIALCQLEEARDPDVRP